jgi:flagellar hook protein FlgE
MNVPGASGMGTVTSNSLEMSNTDIATEFINMITAQKAYSANARVITTEDQMLTELINIKR